MSEEPQAAPDSRLYVPSSEDWRAVVKTGSERQYCYAKSPGDTHFHLILNGEIYLEGETEKLCLNCALRMGVVTTDRLFWQNRVRKPPKSVM